MKREQQPPFLICVVANFPETKITRYNLRARTQALPFPFPSKLKIWSFHVLVMQGLQRNVQKSVMYVQNCCFARHGIKPIVFFRRSRCRRSILRSLKINTTGNTCSSRRLIMWTPMGPLVSALTQFEPIPRSQIVPQAKNLFLSLYQALNEVYLTLYVFHKLSQQIF